MDQLILLRYFFKVLFQSFAMRVSNKYLSVVFPANPNKQVMHPSFIQLFKNIIQQKERREAFADFQCFELCQLNGKQQTFTLALRSHCFELLPVQLELDVVFMYTCVGSLQ